MRQIYQLICQKAISAATNWGTWNWVNQKLSFNPPPSFGPPNFLLVPQPLWQLAVVVNFYDRAYWVLISKLADP